MTAFAFAVAMAALGVNGPEDAVLDWDAVNWRLHEDNVRRLRQRIFKAVQDGDLAKARNLQKLMLRSWSNTLVSVRQATQRNAGRKTAGIDGEVALTSPARMEVAVRVHSQLDTWQPRAVKRVYIPKAGNRAKLRPLGIPVIADRCQQGRVRSALEPEWEARFEPRSYGFRPGRSCQDAAQAIYMTCKGSRAKRVWALDADLASAFDKIDHDRLLEALGSFPARDLIREWLKAGVFEAGKGFAATGEVAGQPVTQRRADRHLPVLAALAVADGQDAGVSVNVGKAQQPGFGHAQAAGVDRADSTGIDQVPERDLGVVVAAVGLGEQGRKLLVGVNVGDVAGGPGQRPGGQDPGRHAPPAYPPGQLPHRSGQALQRRRRDSPLAGRGDPRLDRGPGGRLDPGEPAGGERGETGQHLLLGGVLVARRAFLGDQGRDCGGHRHGGARRDTSRAGASGSRAHLDSRPSEDFR